jgi:hypothetical protein
MPAERTHPHNFNHIIKGSSIHFELLVVVGSDSRVREHALLTLELQSAKIVSRFFC